jgi:4-amino-4-deoxy-L-arabinose transferase-like glycosyltransferase
VKALGYKIYILSKAKVFHEVAASTKQTNNADKIFVKSRFKYLRKHFGMLNAIPVELFLRINKMTVLLFLLTCVALFLRIYNLSRGMSFIGDQGWFYLSARDMLIYGKIPLVGITSSHTWLHQGPLWTYMLSIVLLLSKFNPVSGAYLTVGLGIITTWLMYRVGNEMFSQKVGIIAALLYMCSPLVVVFDRMPFDPSPIPLFTILYLFTLYKWIKGNVNFFPIILLLLAILYNLELATFALVFPFALIFAYGYLKKKSWVRGLLNRKIVFYSLILPIITMLPVIIYDFSHGFKQTIVFVGWTIYKPLSALLVHQASSSHLSISIFLNFLSSSLARLLFQPNQLVAIVLLILSILYLGYIFVSKRSVSKGLLIFTLLVSLLGIIVNQTPSDAYLPIAIPFVILTVAILLAYTSEIRYIKYFSFLLLTLIVLGNSYAVFRNDLTNDFGSRLDATGKIIKLTNNQEYDLIGKGPGSQFSSFTMNYTYLLWWEGHPASNKDVQTKIVVWESPKGIIIYRK